MITYNHQKFIKEALESILSQETNFNIEIIVGEDCSEDDTRNILREYEKLYPSTVKPIYYMQNVGVQQNFVNVIEKCKGKYVALCEGDDFWIDDKKLHKQIDFLEQNQDYSFCFNSSSEVTEDGTEFKVASGKGKNIITLSDVLQEGWFIRTASIVFRKSMLPTFPEFFYTAFSTDYILQIMLLKQGNAYFMDEKMSAYRRHPKGVTNVSKIVNLKRWDRSLKLLTDLDRYTGFNHTAQIKIQKANIKKSITWNLFIWLPASLKIGPKLFCKYFNILTLSKIITAKLFDRGRKIQSLSKTKIS